MRIGSLLPVLVACMVISPAVRADSNPVEAPSEDVQEQASSLATQAPSLTERYRRIRQFIGTDMYGHGGQVVLDTAFAGLRQRHEEGAALSVGIEDLWAHALQEGRTLFDQPDRLWGITLAEETADMIGQHTVGPWQLTTWNIRDHYGQPYGVDPNWTDAQVQDFCRRHPVVQAMMISDYIQDSYDHFGTRSPYAIQRYFWLEPYVKGEIGQADDWGASPVAKPPAGGTWADLTPEMLRNTGFYAKQVFMGAPYTRSGLLFWLVVSGNEIEAREALVIWRDQRRLIPAPEGQGYQLTDESGGFRVTPSDVRHADHAPEIRDKMRALIVEVFGEAE